MPHYFYVSATFSSFFMLQNSLHCLLVASRFMFYTQESRHHIMIDFSLNPRREWCENSEIINKPFDFFNTRCWTERLFKTFSPFSIDFIKFVFTLLQENRAARRAPKRAENRLNAIYTWNSVLRKRFCSLLSHCTSSSEKNFLIFAFYLERDSMFASTKSSCSLKRRLISDKNFTKLGAV